MPWHAQKLLKLGGVLGAKKKILSLILQILKKHLIITSMFREKIKGTSSDKNLYSSSQIFHPTLIFTHKNIQISLSSTPIFGCVFVWGGGD